MGNEYLIAALVYVVSSVGLMFYLQMQSSKSDLSNKNLNRTPRSVTPRGVGSSPRSSSPHRLSLMIRSPSLRDPAYSLPYAGRLGGLDNAGPAKKARRLAKLVKRLNAWYSEQAMNYESDDEMALRASEMALGSICTPSVRI